jgi:hypothetical protein
MREDEGVKGDGFRLRATSDQLPEKMFKKSTGTCPVL